jgi:hypothetical protein
MPKKPIKCGFKIWCCSCSCCGYLCAFQVYNGKPTDPQTGKGIVEKGLVKRVVSDLIDPFSDMNHVLYCDNYFTSGPLADMLVEKKVFLVGTIQRNAAGFPSSLKTVKPPKGSYVSEHVDDKRYFVFHDRKVVCFITNVFPEHMKSKVFRLQPEGLLKERSVPPLLPAYNKYMGGVDRTDQIRKTYGFDRKSRRYWLRLFFNFFDFAINNAYILYKHNCKHYEVRPKDLLAFRLELAHLLLEEATSVRSNPTYHDSTQDNAQGVSVCCLEAVAKLGLKRGRCHQCSRVGRKPPRHTSFGCSVCKVRLCKTTCFAEFHKY